MTEPSPPASTHFLVGSDHEGLRLDRFLLLHTSISRSGIRALVERGGVRVQGQVCRRKGEKLRAGVRVDLDPGILRSEEVPLPRTDLSYPILGEAEGWIALDKPAGVAVHPLRGDQTDTLLNFVCARRPEIAGIGEGGLRSGVLHRLDVETSGVVLFATRSGTWDRLRAAFREHRIDKVYRALVHGQPDEQGFVELFLEVRRHRPARVEVVEEPGPGARLCTTRWRLLESFGGQSLVEIRPGTGFLHQIRVSFAHLGHPLLGDELYGPRRPSLGATRHMLHAARLSSEEIDVLSEDPADFRELCARLRGR